MKGGGRCLGYDYVSRGICGRRVYRRYGSSAAPASQTVLSAGVSNTKMETTDDWNRRLHGLVDSALSSTKGNPSPGDYRIGPDGRGPVTVFDAPDLSQTVRVGGDGEISLPLLGRSRLWVAPRELELVLQALLRQTYMKDPQVTVTVTEMQSHSVSVMGAVKQPGVFQIRGTKSSSKCSLWPRDSRLMLEMQCW